MHLITTLAIYLKFKCQKIRPFYNSMGAKITKKGVKNNTAKVLEGATFSELCIFCFYFGYATLSKI